MRRESLIQRIQQHVEADAGGVLLGVAAAADGFVAFQRAADVVRREDDGPAAVELDAFELRLDLADAGGDRLLAVGGGLRIAERDLADVEAAVGGGEDRVVGGNALTIAWPGQRGGEFAAEGGGERFARADRIGEQRAAAFQVFAKLRASRRR